MRRVSFSEELRSLGEGSEGADAGERWREVIRLHRELGRAERALGRAAWTLRYGERGEWRTVLREAAADSLREARRSASPYDAERLRHAAQCYARLARSSFAEAGAVMLKPGERRGADGRRRRSEPLVQAAAEIRWTGDWAGEEDRRGRRRHGRGGRKNHGAASAAALGRTRTGRL